MKFPTWLKVYGDLEYRGHCPSETSEQIAFFNLLRQQYPALGKIAIHPKNEGKRHMGQISLDKALGLTTGAADIIIPGEPSFVCELKRRDHTQSSWQPGQIEYLEACGGFVCVALGHEAALQAVYEYSQTRVGFASGALNADQ